MTDLPKTGLQKVDLLLDARWVAPMTTTPDSVNENSTLLLENHTCVVHDGMIIDVLPTHISRKQYQAQFEYSLGEHLLMPGLFNGHAHAAMSLLRGFADDHPLMTWLEQHIWPAEAAHVSTAFVKTGTELALCEMLASGVTCFNDMYFFPETVCELLDTTGLRGCVSGPILEFPTSWGKNANDYIDKNTDIIQQYKNHPLIAAGYGPHAPYTVSNTTFEKIIQQATSEQTWIHTHLHETAFEIHQSMTDFGMRPTERLNKLGFFDIQSQAVHMTQITDIDIEILAGKPCHVVHCPESNLKLASGFTPIGKMLDANINISFGTDGAASNNDLDMVSELRTGAILAKAVSENAQTMPAYAAAYAATRGGALAFSQQHLGCVAQGFAADIIAIDLSDLNTQPVYDPIAQFVYASNSRQISHVWVNGKLVCHHGEVKVIDTQKLKAEVKTWRATIAELALKTASQ